ncbi:MAG TPA: FHA domain-containing protein [Kofleriaceae bacterium]|nr:FHA domain-containing protein [Kofleriaceae bacterium]
MKTIGVSLWDGQERGGGNHRTVMRPAVRPRAGMRELFESAYPKFAPACRAVDEPGIAIVAVDESTGRAAGLVKLLARVQRPTAAIVGRHDRCDLFLAGSDRLALRQLAIVLSPVHNWERGSSSVRYRVLDLKTQDGMIDEEGRELRGLRAEGPAFLRCGGYAIFILTLGDPTDWPDQPSDAWQMIPERVYFDELERCPDSSMARIRHLPRERSRRDFDTHHSVVMRTVGPRDTGARLVGADDAAGTLEIIGPHRRTTLAVGHGTLNDGLLLGRYQRCDAVDPDDASLSRVHALLLHDHDRLLMIDTASFNGTRVSGESDARVIVIDRDLEIVLGRKTRARWRWSAS